MMDLYLPGALEELKQYKKWLAWRDESKDGQKAKKPYSTRARAKWGALQWASWTNENQLMTYAEVVEFVQQESEFAFDGLEFVFGTDDPFTFIDLDNVIDENGHFSELAKEVLRLCGHTYAEYSHSGKGLHIIGVGSVPATIKRAGIEIYSTGKPCAITGEAINDNAIEPMQEALNVLYSRYAPAEAALQISSNTPAGAARSTTEAETMARAERGRYAAEFAALFAGKWEGRFSSQSEADLRLMGLLYWYSYQDDEITLSLFKQSGLADRSKAARRGYLERTLQRVKDAPTIRASRAAYQRTPGKSTPAQLEEKKQRTRKYWNE